MDLSVPHLLSHIGNKNHNLLMRHSQSLPKQKRTDALQIPLNISKSPESNFFILGILGPSVARPFKCFLSDVDEACFFHTTSVLICFDEWTTECYGAFDG